MPENGGWPPGAMPRRSTTGCAPTLWVKRSPDTAPAVSPGPASGLPRARLTAPGTSTEKLREATLSGRRASRSQTLAVRHRTSR